MRHLLIAGTALLVLAAPSLADAQCEGGRVSSEQTAGRCCWPGQTWNETAARCEGPPQCPAGFAAEGDSCLQQMAPAPAAPPPQQAPQPAGYGYAPQPGYAPPVAGYAPAPTHPEQRPITGLIITGAIALGVGYVFNIVVGSIYLAASSSSFCTGTQNSWSMFIPLVGGYVWAGIDDDGCGGSSAVGDIFGIPGSSVQVIGLGLLLVGVLVTRTVQVPGPPRASLEPRLANGPGDAGLALAWDF